MRLKEHQIARLAETVLKALAERNVMTLKGERGAVLNAVKQVITANVAEEAALERDAERLLEQTLKAAGGAGIDRFKMLRMVKERLAKERKIVL